jgi:catechol 2,3-dioxygenase-like lactoylglutathione lyase family enzyme
MEGPMTRLASLVLVVRDLDRALAVYEQGLGFSRVDDASDVPSLGARHVFLRGENCLVELLEPHDAEKPPGRFLRARGEGVFAMELRVADPGRARRDLVDAGVEVRGAVPGGEERWWLPPADAHGVLLQVAAPDAPEPG